MNQTGVQSPHHKYIETLKRRHEKRVSDRANFNAHFEELAEYISPRKVGFVGMRTPGEKRMQRVLDATGIHANQLLASGLHGMATNPASRWFALRLVGERVQGEDGKDQDLNELPHIRKWISDVEQVIWQRLYQPGTNFATALDEAYLDLGCFGTAVIFAGQREDGGLLFQARSLSECYIDENADGVVDTLDRCFTMTVRQLLQMEKQDGWTPSAKVKGLAGEQKLDEQIKIIHSVHPRDDDEREYGKKDAMNMAFRSCYFELDECHVLKESGFPEFPYLCPRWMKVSGEMYGRSPGMTALPDIKMLQAKELTYIKALQKNADPPLWLKDDGIIGPTRTIPGGINYWRGDPNQGVMLQPTSIQGLQALVESQVQLRDRIRNIFHVDVLQMLDQREMTLGEARMRLMERMRLMGPLVGRLESELLGPLISRVMGILSRQVDKDGQELIPPAPEEIQDREYIVEFVSPIAMAQQQEQITALSEVFATLAPLGPEIAAQILMKKVNPERLVDWLWDKRHLDPDLLNTDEEMQQANGQEQMQKMIGAMQPIADAAQKGAGAVKSLGDAQAGGGLDFTQMAQPQPNGMMQ